VSVWGVALERVHHELDEQIRIIEAKRRARSAWRRSTTSWATPTSINVEQLDARLQPCGNI
jgi:hypothetical protein